MNARNNVPNPSAVPSLEEMAIAKASREKLLEYLQTPANASILEVQLNDTTATSIQIPSSALPHLIEILQQISQGNTIEIKASENFLSLSQASEFLNVAQGYVLQLLQAGELRFYQIETEYFVNYQDLIAYQKRIKNQQERLLDDLVSQAQELNLGY